MLALVLVAAGAFSAFGQGTIALVNRLPPNPRLPPRFLDAPFFDDEGVLLVGSSYLVQLYAGNSPGEMFPWGTPISFSSGYNSPGYFYGTQGVLVYATSGGGYVWAQVRAWQSAGGLTFEDAARSGAWTGTSISLFTPTGNPFADPPEAPARMFGLRYPGSPMLVDPPANQSVRAGTPATLTARRQGGVELFYQWYGGEKGDTSQPIAGATNATYTTEPLTVNTSYWMKVYYSLGTTNILRLGAQVTVYPADGVSLEIKLSSGNPAVLINGLVNHRYRVESSSGATHGFGGSEDFLI